MINQHSYGLILAVAVVFLALIGCENSKVANKKVDQSDQFNSISFKNNSDRSIWVEQVEGVEGGARCGILGDGAQSTIGGLQLNELDAEVKIKWWYGKSRNPPKLKKDIHESV